MTLTTEYKGSVIAVAIYVWLEEREQIELEPWVCDPDLDTYDEIKTAEHRGYKKCLTQLRELIERTSSQLKELDGD